jgi:hypothetical protein
MRRKRFALKLLSHEALSDLRACALAPHAAAELKFVFTSKHLYHTGDRFAPKK